MDIKDLLNDIGAEVTAERIDSMSQQDRTYHSVGRWCIKMSSIDRSRLSAPLNR